MVETAKEQICNKVLKENIRNYIIYICIFIHFTAFTILFVEKCLHGHKRFADHK